MSRRTKITIIFCVVLILIIGFMIIISPEYQYRNKKCGEVELEISKSLLKDYKKCDIEEIRWYLELSKKWTYYSRGDETFAKKVCHKQGDEYIDIFIYDKPIHIEDSLKGIEEELQFIDLSIINVFSLGVYKQKLFQDSGLGRGVMVTDLILKFSDNFYVEIREYSRDKNRTMTQNAIAELAELFEPKSKKLEILISDGSFYTDGINNIEIRNYGGIYHIVKGYVNLDSKCRIFIKVLDKDTDEIYFVQEDNMMRCIPGWDKNQNYYHSFEYNLPIMQYADTGEYKVELWAENEDDESNCIFDKVVFIDFSLDRSN